MTAAPTKAVEVFYSYAHKDEKLRNELEKHLKSLQRQGFITQWHDRKIVAGTAWGKAIDTHLNTASIILLLISPDFMASDYCYDVEMQRAMERHHTHEARVIPILLRPVEWSGTPFEQLQALPTNAKPITAWRNRDQAFLDVTRGIRAAIESLTMSQVQQEPTIPSLWSVPYRRNPYFTGQETLLSLLHSTLTAAKTPVPTQPQAISGLGGIGKTQLALEYAYRHRDEYQAVLWAKAESYESLVLDFVNFAQVLQLPQRDAQDHTITVMAVKHWLNSHDRWLLILDNADDLALLDPFLPASGKGHILLTTRTHAQGTFAQGIAVEQMQLAEGTLLLLRRARVLTPQAPLEQASAADRSVAQQIVEMLGGLPLALDQAGAYIEETGCSLHAYLDRYRSQRTRLLRRRGRLVTDHPESVTTTWSLSFEKVKQTSPVATQLLAFCAFLHPDSIPEELLTEEVPDVEPTRLVNDLIAFDEGMESLRAYSLVRRHAGTEIVSIHRLVQAVLRDAMTEDQQQHWAERAVRVVNSLFPSGEPETWHLCERYLLTVQTCADLIAAWNMVFPEAINMLNQAGVYLVERAEYEQAEPLLLRALAIREQMLGANHPNTAQSLNNLAYLYEVQGQYEQAEPLYKRALAIHEQVLGANHPDTIIVRANYAVLEEEMKGRHHA